MCFKDIPNIQSEDRGLAALSSVRLSRARSPRSEPVVVPGRQLPPPPSSLSPSLQGTCVSERVPSLDCSSCHPPHEQFVLEPSSFPKEAIPANSISGQGREVTGNANKIYEVPISSPSRTRKGCLSCQFMIN